MTLEPAEKGSKGLLFVYWDRFISLHSLIFFFKEPFEWSVELNARCE